MAIHWGKIVHDLKDLAAATSAGFDRVLLPVELIYDLDENEFTRIKERFESGDTLPSDFFSPLPTDVRVTEMGFNLYVWTEYLKKVMGRIAKLGCRRICWNDGRARVLPWEGDIAGVKEQVLQFLYMLCEVAEDYDVTVLVEPLGPKRTNFLNSMEEVREFIPRIGKDNVSSMISLRELEEIGLSIEEIAAWADLVDQVQLEHPFESTTRRVAPRPEDDDNLYLPLLKALHKSDYSGIICLPEGADGMSLGYCTGLWDRLG